MKTIVKVIRQKKGFSCISNRLLEDARMSFKAKGVLCYLLSRPDDWTVRTEDLVNRSTDGRHAIWSAMRELRQIGYAEMSYFREGNKLIGRRWVIYECPRQVFSATQVSGATENHHHTNTDRDTSYHSVLKRNEADASSLGFSLLNGEHPEDDSPSSKLCRRFWNFLVKKNLHLNRSDLPSGNTAQSKRRRSITIDKWKKSFAILLQQQGDLDRVKEVMEWYFTHFRDPYVGTYRAATTFCENFLKVEKAMCRGTGEKPQPKSRNVYTWEWRNGERIRVCNEVDEDEDDE
jgi:hypothetical protein